MTAPTRLSLLVLVLLAAAGAASARPAAAPAPVVVGLGTHAFGHTRSGALVAHASPRQVGWLHEGIRAGPESFVVAPDRSIWLHDEVNHRVLVWRAGRPNATARTISLPFVNAEDVALGPASTLYFDRGVPELRQFQLYRMSLATGKILWHVRLGGAEVGGNTSLRTGPDGRLYALVPPNDRWMPIATADGRPLPVLAQRRRIGYQPVPAGLRLVRKVVSARELRVGLVDRAGADVRSWRIVSRTPVNFTGFYSPGLVGGDPVIALDVQSGVGTSHVTWEYEVLRLTRSGASVGFSLRHAVYGEQLFADLHVGPDGALYQLTSSPKTGVSVLRYGLGSGS